MNKINKNFWLVTKATSMSEMADICFEINFRDLQNQFRGGLDPDDIVGMFDGEVEAVKFAAYHAAHKKSEDDHG